MTLTPLVLSVLLAAAPSKPSTVEGSAAFEQVKRLSGAWKSKDAQFLTLRLISGGAAVLETVQTASGALRSVTVYRLEGSELVAERDGQRHAALRLLSASDTQLTFGDKSSGTTLTLSLGTADALTESLVFRADAGEVCGTGVFVREYVDTLK